jgi:hypothetical protein
MGITLNYQYLNRLHHISNSINHRKHYSSNIINSNSDLPLPPLLQLAISILLHCSMLLLPGNGMMGWGDCKESTIPHDECV